MQVAWPRSASPSADRHPAAAVKLGLCSGIQPEPGLPGPWLGHQGFWPCPFQFRSIEVIGSITCPSGVGDCSPPPPARWACLVDSQRPLPTASVGVIAVSWWDPH